jgi:hypothetical protein
MSVAIMSFPAPLFGCALIGSNHLAAGRIQAVAGFARHAAQ